MDRKKICFFTGSRAEYGLLRPLILKVKNENEFQIQIIASGTHLSPEFGLTYREIEQDGFAIDEKIEMLLSSDTGIGVGKSMGVALIGYSDALNRLKPDVLVVLGDRFEALAIATAAYVLKIPIAHIHGGEKTIGTLDDAFRHSITKMSCLHFASTEEYRKRIIQLGEHPRTVFNVGAVGLDNLRGIDFLSKEQLEIELNFKFGSKNILFTYHPTTLKMEKIDAEMAEIFSALSDLVTSGYKIIITKSNADEGGRYINKLVDEFAQKNGMNVLAITSMGTLRYLSVMKYVDFVMGNSSSGIIEAPSLKVPTINIGERQKGRVKGNSVIDVEPCKNKILHAVKIVEQMDKAMITNPYDNGGASEKIYVVLKNNLENNCLDIRKEFFDIDFDL